MSKVKKVGELQGGLPEPHWKEQRDESVRQMIKIKPLTPNQGIYIKAIESSVITVATGPAGSGKTLIACGKAAEYLREGHCQKIVVTRPLVSCGKGIGWLPGSVDEKVGPFMRPVIDAFGEFFSINEIERYVHGGKIEIIPLELMRGLTLKEAFVICDEAQNAEFNQLHMLLTRVGNGTKVIVTGDATKTQTDLATIDGNPLKKVIEKFNKKGLRSDVAIVILTRKDIVRHPIVQWVDEALTDENNDITNQNDWFETKCPKCYNTNYDDLADAVSLKCWNCGIVFSLPDEGQPEILYGEAAKFYDTGFERPN